MSQERPQNGERRSKPRNKLLTPSDLFREGSERADEGVRSLRAKWFQTFLTSVKKDDLSKFLRTQACMASPSTSDKINMACCVQAGMAVAVIAWVLIDYMRVNINQASVNSTNRSDSGPDNNVVDDRWPMVSYVLASAALNLLFPCALQIVLKLADIQLAKQEVICVISALYFSFCGLLAPIASLALHMRWVFSSLLVCKELGKNAILRLSGR